MSIWQEAFAGRQLPPSSLSDDPAKPEQTIRVPYDTPIDRIVWQHYGHLQATVEKVLEANPGLADFGATVPGGTKIVLPRIPDRSRRRLTAPRVW